MYGIRRDDVEHVLGEYTTRHDDGRGVIDCYLRGTITTRRGRFEFGLRGVPTPTQSLDRARPRPVRSRLQAPRALLVGYCLERRVADAF